MRIVFPFVGATPLVAVGLAFLVIAGFAHAAAPVDRKLPRELLGEWCFVNSSNESTGATYRRGHCPTSEGRITVNVDGFRGHESDCKALDVAVVRSGNYRVKFTCRGEGETWTQDYRMSLEKGKLIMTELGASP